MKMQYLKGSGNDGNHGNNGNFDSNSNRNNLKDSTKK